MERCSGDLTSPILDGTIRYMSSVKEKYKKYLNSEVGARKYNRFKRILYGNPDPLVLKLFKIIYPKVREMENIHILDVGGGDGKRLRLLMKLFRQRSIRTEATLVEPSDAFVKNLRRALKNQQKKNVLIKNCIFEDFLAKEKFDLIFFIHSIYTFKNDFYLQKAVSLLAPDGMIIIISNGRNSFLGELKKVTDADFGSNRREVTSLVNDLKKIGLKYKQISFYTVFPNCLKNNELTTDGKLITEWIALRPYATIPQDTIADATKTFIAKSNRGKIREQEIVTLI